MKTLLPRWGFRVGLSVFFVLSIICYLSIHQFVQMTGWVNHTSDVLRQLSKIQIEIERMEGSQRGFLLTGQSSFLEIFQDNRSKIDVAVAELMALVRDNKVQAENAHEVRSLIAARIDKMLLVTQMRKDGVNMQKIAAAIDTEIMQNLRSRTAEMENIEKGLLKDRMGKVDAQAERVLGLIIFGGILSVLIVVVSRQLMKQSSRERSAQMKILSSVVNSLGDGLVIVNAEGKLLNSNPASKEILGTQDLVNSPADRPRVLGFHHPATGLPMQPDETPLSQALQGNPCDDREVLVKNAERPNGFYIAVSARPIRTDDGEMIGSLALFRDVTVRKSIDEDRQRAREMALEASRLKSEFLATMSHEIRTPMNGVIGMTTLLLDSDLNSQQISYAKTIKSSADSLLTLINGILDHSKIEAGKLSLDVRDFDLQKLAQDVRDVFVYMARSKNLDFQFDVTAGLKHDFKGDVDRLRQVLINLVGNAFKFTERGFVSLVINEVAETDTTTTLRFEVRDTGIGMSEKAQTQLFQKFSQVHEADREKLGGTGLGLAISKELVKLMHGELQVSSALGLGSKFWFEVTLEKSARTMRTEAHQLKPAMKKLSGHVLVAEDHVVNRAVVQSYLSKCGLQSTIVENGLEAVEMYVANPGRFQLILMDCQMPVMNGLEATRKIRAWETSHTAEAIPIVALTAEGRAEDRERCLQSGMNDFLMKPIDLPTFNQTVASWLKPKSGLLDLAVIEKLSQFAADGSTLDQILIAKFRESTPSQVLDLLAAGEKKNFEDIRFLSHALKSACLTLGLASMADSIEQIEFAAEKSEDVHEKIQRLPDLFKLAEIEFQDYLKRVVKKTA